MAFFLIAIFHFWSTSQWTTKRLQPVKGKGISLKLPYVLSKWQKNVLLCWKNFNIQNRSKNIKKAATQKKPDANSCQGSKGNVTTKTHDFSKILTCLLGGRLCRWKQRIPACFRSNHQSGVTDTAGSQAAAVPNAVHSLWILIKLDTETEVEAPSCDNLEEKGCVNFHVT